MDNITIPDEVVWKLHDKLLGSSQFSVEEGRAAILAALKAWTGNYLVDEWYFGTVVGTALVLPIKQETDA